MNRRKRASRLSSQAGDRVEKEKKERGIEESKKDTMAKNGADTATAFRSARSQANLHIVKKAWQDAGRARNGDVILSHPPFAHKTAQFMLKIGLLGQFEDLKGEPMRL